MKLFRWLIVLLTALIFSGIIWKSKSLYFEVAESNDKRSAVYKKNIKNESSSREQLRENDSMDTLSKKENNSSLESLGNTVLVVKPNLADASPLAVENISQENRIDTLWRKYSDQLPKLFRGNYSKDINSTWSSEDMEKYRADDALRHDAAILTNELRKEQSIGLSEQDISRWKERFNTLREKHIKVALSGDHYGAWWLGSEYLAYPIKDDVERLAWVLIAVALGGQTNSMQICDPTQFICTDDLFMKAIDRAKFYIDYYEFHTTAKAE